MAAEGVGASVDVKGAASGLQLAEDGHEESPVLVVNGAAKPREAVSEGVLHARDVPGNELDVAALQEVEEPHEQRGGESPMFDRANGRGVVEAEKTVAALELGADQLDVWSRGA